jgi:hypothetical protein
MVGGPDEGSDVRIAEIARRRWASQARRLRPGADHDRRVEDLAKGLVAAFEPDPRLIGPEIADYRFVARLLAAVFAPQFAIGFGGVAGRTIEHGPHEAVAHIVLGDFDELMLVPLDHWDRSTYERQWRSALDAIVDGWIDRHALLTSVYDPPTASFFGWWPMWRSGDRIVVANGMAHTDHHDLAAVLDDPGAQVPDLDDWLTPADEDDPPVSRWEVHVADVIAFLVGWDPARLR